MSKIMKDAMQDLRIYHAQRTYNRDAIFLTNQIENLESLRKRSGFLSQRDEEQLALYRKRLAELGQHKRQIVDEVYDEYRQVSRDRAAETARIRRWRHHKKKLQRVA